MKHIALSAPLLVISLSACQQSSQAPLPDIPTSLGTSESSPSLTSQNIYSGTRLAGTTGARFAAWYDASVATYGYTGAFDNARASWNGISSKVAIDKSTTYVAANDSYFVSPDDRSPYVGITYYYTSEGNTTAADQNANWHHSAIVMYNGTLARYDAATRSNYIRRCTIHEIGHSLKQDHDTQPSGTSIMNPECALASGVMQYNKSELIRKWGQ